MPDSRPTAARSEEQLESWKEIAAYLGRGVRTVVRWEKSEGLPVHRHLHERRSSVFAYKSEIDAWWESRRSALDAESTQTQSATPPVRPRRWSMLAASIVTVGLGLWFLRSAPAPDLQLPLNFQPLTSYPGRQYAPSFSPDGSHFAFAWDGGNGDQTDLYVQAVGSAEPKRLTAHSWMDFSPAWSPDGKFIAFVRRSPQRRIELLLIPSLGGMERKLADVKEQHYMDAPQLSWSPDGKWLAFADCAEDGCGIFLLAPETGERRRLTKAAGPRNDLDPAFSPTGRQLAFRRGPTQSHSEIYLQALTDGTMPTGDPVPLTNRGVRSTSPVWSADGRSIFFSSGMFNSPSANIYRVRVNPRGAEPPLRLTASNEGDHFNLGASWRTGVLACTRQQQDINIWKIQKTGDVWGEGKPIPRLSSTGSDHDPDVSPDGQYLAFVSDRSGDLELWVSRIDGSQARAFTSFEGSYVASPRWSPDGTRITFSALYRNAYSVWTIDAGGGPARKIAEPAWSSSWSHDGKWIYYSPPVHHASRVFKVPSAGGSSVMVVEIPKADDERSGSSLQAEVGWEVGSMPMESKDGRVLFFKSSQGIWKFPLAGGRPELVTPVLWYTPYAVSRDGLFFHGEAAPGTSSRVLLHYRFADGLISEVARTGPRPAMGLGVSPDDKTVLVSQLDREMTNLLFVRGLW